MLRFVSNFSKIEAYWINKANYILPELCRKLGKNQKIQYDLLTLSWRRPLSYRNQSISASVMKGLNCCHGVKIGISRFLLSKILGSFILSTFMTSFCITQWTQSTLKRCRVSTGKGLEKKSRHQKIVSRF